MLLSKKPLLSSGAHAAHGAHDNDDHPHVMPLPIYFGVFAFLLVMTVVTVGVSVIGLPPLLAIVVAMVVATAKASLVVLYFMHLRYESPFYAFIFCSALFFIGLCFILILIDMNSRAYFVPEESTEFYRNEQLNLKIEKDGPAGKAAEPAE